MTSVQWVSTQKQLKADCRVYETGLWGEKDATTARRYSMGCGAQLLRIQVVGSILTDWLKEANWDQLRARNEADKDKEKTIVVTIDI